MKKSQKEIRKHGKMLKKMGIRMPKKALISELILLPKIGGVTVVGLNKKMKKKCDKKMVVTDKGWREKVIELTQKPRRLAQKLKKDILLGQKKQKNLARKLKISKSRLKIARESENHLLVTKIQESLLNQKKSLKKHAKILKKNSKKLKRTEKVVNMISRPSMMVVKAQQKLVWAERAQIKAQDAIATETINVTKFQTIISDKQGMLELALAQNRDSDAKKLQKEIEIDEERAQKAKNAIAEAKKLARRQKRVVRRSKRQINKTHLIERAVLSAAQEPVAVSDKRAVKKIGDRLEKKIEKIEKKEFKMKNKKARNDKQILAQKLEIQKLDNLVKKSKGKKSAEIVAKFRIYKRKIFLLKKANKKIDKKQDVQSLRKERTQNTLYLVKNRKATLNLAKKTSELQESLIKEHRMVIKDFQKKIHEINLAIQKKKQQISQYKAQKRKDLVEDALKELAQKEKELRGKKVELRTRKWEKKEDLKKLKKAEKIINLDKSVKELVKNVKKNKVGASKAVKREILKKQDKKVKILFKKIVKIRVKRVQLREKAKKLLKKIKKTFNTNRKKDRKILKKVRKNLKKISKKISQKRNSLKKAKMTIKVIKNPNLVNSVKKSIKKVRKVVAKSRKNLRKSISRLIETKLLIDKKNDQILKAKEDGNNEKADRLSRIIADKQKEAIKYRLKIDTQKKKMRKQNSLIKKK